MWHPALQTYDLHNPCHLSSVSSQGPWQTKILKLKKNWKKLQTLTILWLESPSQLTPFADSSSSLLSIVNKTHTVSVKTVISLLRSLYFVIYSKFWTLTLTTEELASFQVEDKSSSRYPSLSLRSFKLSPATIGATPSLWTVGQTYQCPCSCKKAKLPTAYERQWF